MKALCLACALAFWAISAGLALFAYFALAESSGRSPDMGVMAGALCLVSLGGGVACAYESRGTPPRGVMLLAMVCLTLLGMSLVLTVAAFIYRNAAHGAMSGLIVIFGTASFLLAAVGCVAYFRASSPCKIRGTVNRTA